MLLLHESWAYEVPLKCLTAKIQVHHYICWKSVPVLVPPDTSGTLQLMSYIFHLQTVDQPEQVELLFHRVQPFLNLKGFLSLLEGWGLGIHEVLETAILVGVDSS